MTLYPVITYKLTIGIKELILLLVFKKINRLLNKIRININSTITLGASIIHVCLYAALIKLRVEILYKFKKKFSEDLSLISLIPEKLSFKIFICSPPVLDLSTPKS